MVEKELLPIGSVVVLKGGLKKLMIIGVLQIVQQESETKRYDYIGVIFPEGFLNADLLVLFNHDQLDEVVYRGFENDEYREFVDRISEITAFIS